MANFIEDGAYQNAVTGLGTLEMDKTEHTLATPYRQANLKELARMKMQDGIANTIVSDIPQVAFMNEPSIIGDDAGIVIKEAYQKGLLEALQMAGEEQRLTGGAVIITEYDDGTDLKDAPKERAKITGYRVYSSGEVNLSPEDFDGDEPKHFRIIRLDGVEKIVNVNRCTVIHGIRLPGVLGSASIRERFFGASALKPVEKALKDLATVTGSIVNMATETGTLLMSLDGLNEMLSKPDSGIHDLHQLLSTIKLSMNSMRAAFAGANDKFEILSHNFSGLPETIQKLMILVSAKAKIPMSILFGQTATGLSQTNAGDLKEYAKEIDSWRRRYIYKPACKLFSEIGKRNCGIECSEFNWGTIDTRTIEEELNARKTQEETLLSYLNAGVLSAEEIRKAVFENGHSFEVSVK